jgi:hypothetical protein
MWAVQNVVNVCVVVPQVQAAPPLDTYNELLRICEMHSDLASVHKVGAVGLDDRFMVSSWRLPCLQSHGDTCRTQSNCVHLEQPAALCDSG